MYLWVLNMIRKRLFSTEGKIKPMYFLSEVLSQKFTQKTNISMPILFVIQTDLESFRTMKNITSVYVVSFNIKSYRVYSI